MDVATEEAGGGYMGLPALLEPCVAVEALDEDGAAASAYASPDVGG
jgi:hypothetical protein